MKGAAPDHSSVKPDKSRKNGGSDRHRRFFVVHPADIRTDLRRTADKPRSHVLCEKAAIDKRWKLR